MPLFGWTGICKFAAEESFSSTKFESNQEVIVRITKAGPHTRQPRGLGAFRETSDNVKSNSSQVLIAAEVHRPAESITDSKVKKQIQLRAAEYISMLSKKTLSAKLARFREQEARRADRIIALNA